MIALVVFLFAVALENLLPLRGRAEAADFHRTLGNMRSAMHMRLSKVVIEDGTGAASRLVEQNPLDWLHRPPDAYAGEVGKEMAPERIPRGAWAYDPRKRLLYYRVRYPQYFEGSRENPVIRMKVRLDYSDVDGDGRFGRADRLRGVELARLGDYGWKEPSGSEAARILGLTDSRTNQPDDEKGTVEQ